MTAPRASVQLTDEQSQVEVDGPRLVALARHVLHVRRVPPDMHTGILLVDRDTIASLNEAHMGVSGPTDVLAFPIDQPGTVEPDVPAVLGDVVVCPAVAHEQAARLGRSPQAEVEYLLVHGVLHLLGMDHADDEERDAMFGLTDDLLTSFAAASA